MDKKKATKKWLPLLIIFNSKLLSW
jgi:hypothetical protein